MNEQQALQDAAIGLLAHLKRQQAMIATVESCTGGMIAATLTDISGSSAAVEGGLVTYSNEAKHNLAGGPMALIERHGAVSEPVARAMAEGGLQATRADIAVAVTGVAGPGGGSAEKPVGLVHLACAARGVETLHERHLFADRGRGWIRRETVAQAFRLAHRMLHTRA